MDRNVNEPDPKLGFFLKKILNFKFFLKIFYFLFKKTRILPRNMLLFRKKSLKILYNFKNILFK